MQCHRIQKRLNEAGWLYSVYSQDKEIMEHLEKCPSCAAQVQVEQALRNDIATISQKEPETDLPLSSIREKAEQADGSPAEKGVLSETVRPAFSGLIGEKSFRKLAIGVAVIVFVLIALIPFKFQEKVGYGISISGVDKNIAVNSKGIFPLLDALGMEDNKTAILMDSLNIKEINLYVGECSETCDLKISQLKTERDVELIMEAIIELGCCEIDDVYPIFHDESSSLLRLVTKKLFS